MTSRVEAVESAMDKALRELGNQPIIGGRNQGKHAATVHALAQAAIEASDAWMEEQGWKTVPKTRTGAMIQAAAKTGSHDPNSWYDMWDAAPTPEDTDQ